MDVKKIDLITEHFETEEFLLIDGFDDAIIGVYDCKLVYSRSKCLEVLRRDMDEIEAIEYFDFNVAGAYVGEKTPIIIDDECFDTY